MAMHGVYREDSGTPPTDLWRREISADRERRYSSGWLRDDDDDGDDECETSGKTLHSGLQI